MNPIYWLRLLVLIPLSSAAAQTLEVEPNNTVVQANVITSRVTITGQLSSATDVDTFVITTSAPTVLTVAFSPDSRWHTVTVLNSVGTALSSVTVSRGASMPPINAPAPGNYYVQVKSSGVYADVQYNLTVIIPGDPAPPPARLINLSIMANVATNELITAGFVVDGNGNRRVLVRVIGPTLASFGVGGVNPDPQLTLFNATTRTVIGSNLDWNNSDAEVMQRVGAFALPTTSRDAALVVTLPPGNYSVQAAGQNGVGGIVLLEVYEVP